MSDTQAAMREFRFLDETRKTNGLTPAEEERWYELAQALGVDVGQQQAQPQGYYAQDGNWYPYPAGYDPATGQYAYPDYQQQAAPGWYPPPAQPQGYYAQDGNWYPYPPGYDPATGQYYQGYPPAPGYQQWPQQQPWPGQQPAYDPNAPAQPQWGYPAQPGYPAAPADYAGTAWPDQQQPAAPTAAPMPELPPEPTTAVGPKPPAEPAFAVAAAEVPVAAPAVAVEDGPLEVSADDVMEVADDEVSPVASSPSGAKSGEDAMASLRNALSLDDEPGSSGSAPGATFTTAAAPSGLRSGLGSSVPRSSTSALLDAPAAPKPSSPSSVSGRSNVSSLLDAPAPLPKPSSPSSFGRTNVSSLLDAPTPGATAKPSALLDLPPLTPLIEVSAESVKSEAVEVSAEVLEVAPVVEVAPAVHSRVPEVSLEDFGSLEDDMPPPTQIGRIPIALTAAAPAAPASEPPAPVTTIGAAMAAAPVPVAKPAPLTSASLISQFAPPEEEDTHAARLLPMEIASLDQSANPSASLSGPMFEAGALDDLPTRVYPVHTKKAEPAFLTPIPAPAPVILARGNPEPDLGPPVETPESELPVAAGAPLDEVEIPATGELPSIDVDMTPSGTMPAMPGPAPTLSSESAVLRSMLDDGRATIPQSSFEAAGPTPSAATSSPSSADHLLDDVVPVADDSSVSLKRSGVVAAPTRDAFGAPSDALGSPTHDEPTSSHTAFAPALDDLPTIEPEPAAEPSAPTFAPSLEDLPVLTPPPPKRTMSALDALAIGPEVPIQAPEPELPMAEFEPEPSTDVTRLATLGIPAAPAKAIPLGEPVTPAAKQPVGFADDWSNVPIVESPAQLDDRPIPEEKPLDLSGSASERVELASSSDFVAYTNQTEQLEVDLDDSGPFAVDSSSLAALATNTREAPATPVVEEKLELASNADFINEPGLTSTGEKWDAVDRSVAMPTVEVDVLADDGGDIVQGIVLEEEVPPVAPSAPQPELTWDSEIPSQSGNRAIKAMTPPASTPPPMSFAPAAEPAAPKPARVIEPAPLPPAPLPPPPKPVAPVVAVAPAPSSAAPLNTRVATPLAATPVTAPKPVEDPFDRSGAPFVSSDSVQILVSGEHRVILHTVEGQVKRGSIREANLGAETVVLEGTSVENLPRARVKAIFFMLAPGARAPAGEGQKVRVTFKDGRQVAGFSRDQKNASLGFFVVPADNRTNTERIFIYRHAVQNVVVEAEGR